jgi:outer membrane cobalamin receptor
MIPNNLDVSLEGQVKLEWRVQYNVENIFYKGYKIMYSYVQFNQVTKKLWGSKVGGQ